jgi:hypothetical protein
MVFGTKLFLWGEIYAGRNKMIGFGNKIYVKNNINKGNELIRR